MTRDEVIAMAEQAGIDCDTDGDIWGSTNGALLKFAALVAAAEREACAKVCETHTFGSPWQTTKYEQEPSTTRKPKMPEITLDKAASVSKLAQNQLAELRSEIARLRMFEPCCKRDSLPASQSINPTNLEYWGIA